MGKRFWILFCLVCVIAVLSGCATTVKTTEQIPGELTGYITPEIETVSKAFIGDTVVKEWQTLTQDTITLTANFGLKRITAVHPKDEYILIGKMEDLLVYQNGSTYYDGWLNRKSQLLEDPVGAVYRKTYSGTSEVPKDKYDKGEKITDASDPVLQAFIYMGAEDSILKFTYLEFTGDMVRPAFSSETTYDIREDNRVRYKNLFLEVLSFDNQGITYRLISGFKAY